MPSDSPYAAQLAGLPVHEREIVLLGSRTHYWEYGPADARVTLVLVHGFRGEHHGLEPLIAQLRDLRIISPDLPGFGDSTPLTDAPHTIPGYSRWLIDFVDALALPERPVVLGHSFGSIVSAAAVAGGLDIPSLILMNPIAAPALAGPKAALTALAVFYYRAATWLPEAAGRRLLGNPLIVRFTSLAMVKTRDRRLRRWIHSQHDTYFSRFADRRTLLEAFRASTTSNVLQFAPAIRVPTLLIAAADDPITSVADEEKLLETLPDARLHVLPGVGHLIHYERPRDAAALLVDFLGVGRLGERS